MIGVSAFPFRPSQTESDAISFPHEGEASSCGIRIGGFVFLGMLQFSRGRVVWIGSHHLPMFSGAEIALAVVLLVLSVTPFSWIEKGLRWVDRCSGA